MKQWWSSFYRNNKAIVLAAVVAVIISIGVLIKVKDEVTRFTLIMPVFAGFILFSILVTSDEELGDVPEEEEKVNTPKEKAENKIKTTVKKKTSRK